MYSSPFPWYQETDKLSVTKTDHAPDIINAYQTSNIVNYKSGLYGIGGFYYSAKYK